MIISGTADLLRNGNLKIERALILAGGGARGAFQAGVLKFLKEADWQPDLICGTSVGAINAVALGSGLDPAEIAKLWMQFDRQKIYRIAPAGLLRSFFKRDRFRPPLDTAPLKRLLTKYLNPTALKASKAEIIITAINMQTSQLEYFTKAQITIEHLMASSAIPLLFPWQYIDHMPYWDGGFMANAPIWPALKAGAAQIITVLLSPVGCFPQKLPQTPMAAAEMALEHLLLGSYRLACLNPIHTASSSQPHPAAMATVAPARMLGFRSLLSFSPRQTRKLIQEGYENARKQLSHIL
jgi:NTE family protein